MTTYKSSLQFAGADGTVVDGTNSALPDGFTGISIGASTTMTAQTDANSVGGTRVLRITPSGSSTCYFGWTGMTGTSLAGAAARFLMKTPVAWPTGNQAILYFRTGGGGSGLGWVGLYSTGKLHVQSDNDSLASATDAATALTLSTWYDISVQISNPSSSTGTLTVTVRDLAGTTVSGAGFALTGVNYGPTACGTVRLGITSAIAGGVNLIYKYVAVQTGSNAEIAAWWVNTPPTVTITTADPYQLAGTPAALSASIADAEGLASSQWAYMDDDDDGLFTGSWTNMSTTTVGAGGTSGTSSTSDSAPPVGVRRYRCQVTDSGGTTAEAFVTGWYYAATGTPVAVRFVVPGTYTNAGTSPQANMKQAMNDTTPTSGFGSWAESVSGPVNSVFVMVYEPHGPGDITVNVDLAIRDVSPTIPATLTPRKADDTAQLDLPQIKNPTTTPLTYPFVFTTAGNAAAGVADRKALRMNVSGTTN